MEPKIFIGPMSKNIVDSIIQFANENDTIIGMIPSRRQIEYNGGYVNNWKTNEFINYVRQKTDRVMLERDHGGPMQGYEDDDGLKSYKEDSLCGFDIIHVDPFKKYRAIEHAAQHTIENIIFCNNHNNECYYEVGTEEGIRKYSHEELDKFLNILYKQLGPLFERIKFAVIQSGTKLQSGENILKLDEDKCYKMVNVCKKYGLLSKEHNGDFISLSDIKKRFDLGLSAINIAPEFGAIETKCILNYIEKDNKEDLFNSFYNMCYNSRRWEKWFPKDFKPELERKKLIQVSGHYVFSENDFLQIKKQLPGIDGIICKQIMKKIKLLHSI